MFETYLGKLLFLCPLIFVAMFIDSIAGGGGVITVPAYLFTGMPITTVYGTNKFVACCGTTFGAGNYIRKKCVNWTVAIPAVAGALTGSFLGAQLTLHLEQDILQIVLVILLPLIALFMIFNRGFGDDEKVRAKPARSKIAAIIIGLLIGLVVGCYDGFFGPVAGCLLGSQCAIKKGAKFIKIIMIIAAMLLLIKIVFDFVKTGL